MIARTVKSLAWVLGVFLSFAAGAVPVQGLYRAEIAVANKGESELKRAEQEGLKTVLVKVSGSAGVVKHPLVIKALARVEPYVSEAGYHKGESQGGLAPQTIAVINYSQSMVDRLLTRAGQPIWPADRPELLVWMVVDMPRRGRSHVSREVLPEAGRILTRQMALRGQKLARPLLDLEDRMTLSAQDAWEYKREPLAAAARRYQVENWCVLRLYQTGSGTYRGTVQVEAGAHSGLGNINAKDLQGVIHQAVNFAVDRVAADSSFVRQVSSEEFSLLLENVASYRDYKAAVRLLEDLEMVRSVRVTRAVGDRLDLRLAIDGGSAALLKMLRRNKRLEEMINLAGARDSGRFRWR